MMAVDGITFSNTVVKFMDEDRDSWISGIIKTADHFGIELKDVRELLSTDVMEKLEQESITSNLIKVESKLPI